MPLSYEYPQRGSRSGLTSAVLEDRFELLKEIGDGSFGSVALARVRTAGAQVARRGTLVAIKTMKKTFESYSPCMELREVIFLRSVPAHVHLVPALDIFLDPLSKKLHICMENMDGNLYQLMKSRDHKCLDPSSVKSILFQILSGLSHIHAHRFFHRDIKPENILVSTSAPQDAHNTFRRYSSMITPPSTPPSYTVKIADFGLARETHSSHPYTTYVSTRWYRAPEVLLRAGEYSAPVDIWALGAMAVEVANLKPLFPGGNEVDQVWRVCEIMGSPGNWYDKAGNKVGGGDWRDGTRLAQKLGFSFPKMAPHSMETILRPPQWPVALSNFVTWCLMWDPRNRPTSTEALRHEYFNDAVDPLRPKSSASRILSSKKHVSMDVSKLPRESTESNANANATKQSWFRRSLIKEQSAAPLVPAEPAPEPVAAPPQVPSHAPPPAPPAPPVPAPVQQPRVEQSPPEPPPVSKFRPFGNKRATWNNGPSNTNAAPMPILPSIRPITPFSATVNAQGRHNSQADSQRQTPTGVNAGTPPAGVPDVKPGKKIGRQLSVQSQSNHYAELHRQDAERALNGQRSPQSPSAEQKEGFFSHLRKRARRFSGKPVGALPPDDEPGSGRNSNRNSMAIDSVLEEGSRAQQQQHPLSPAPEAALSAHPVQYSRHPAAAYYSGGGGPVSHLDPSVQRSALAKSVSTSALDQGISTSSVVTYSTGALGTSLGGAYGSGPISSRTRRALHQSTRPSQIYDAPDEEDELLQEALSSAQCAQNNMDVRAKADDTYYRTSLAKLDANINANPSPGKRGSANPNPYPTPSPSAKRNGRLFDQQIMTEPMTSLNLNKHTTKHHDTAAARTKENVSPRWPTPPYEENEWAASAAASIFAAGSVYR